MRRSFVIFAIALLTLAASAAAAGSLRTQQEWALRGVRDAVREDALPYRLPRLGVNAALEHYDVPGLHAQLDRMQSIGVTWVRQMVRWDALAPEAHTIDWGAWDVIADAFRARPSLQLVAVLVNSPAWARLPAANSASGPPADPADFANFAAAFAARYGDVINIYQIWDEPNLDDAWGGLDPSPSGYLALLSAAYPAIHAADADAQVLAAALAPTVETGPHNLQDVIFLDALLSLGGLEVMDGAAGKPYGFSLPPDDRTVSPLMLNFSRLIALREVLERHGAGRLPLWASQWGWYAQRESAPASIWGSVTPTQQADYTLAALDRAEREWPWLGGMILEQWQSTAPDDPRAGFALISPDGEDRPVMSALSARAQPPSASNGLYPATTDSARYSGVWTFGPLGADIGWVGDSRVRFTFSGSDIALRLRQGDYVARLYATIDGAPANALPRDSAGNAFVLLTSDTLQPEDGLVLLASNLGGGEHVLELSADSGWDRWALQGYAVSDGDPAASHNRAQTAVFIAVLCAAVAACISGAAVPWRRWLASARPIVDGISAAANLVASFISALVLMTGMLLTWSAAAPEFFRREPAPLLAVVLTAGLIYLSPGLLLTLAAGAVLFVLVYHRPLHGLMLTIGFAPFFLFPVELFRFAFPMAELTLGITAAAWLLREAVSWARARQSAISGYSGPALRERLLSLHTLDIAMLCYVLLGAFGLTVAQQRAPALTELRVLFIEPALFYLILRRTARTRVDVLMLIDALLTAALLVCAIGLVQAALGQGIIQAEGGARRLASVYGSPNNAALFLERALAFALAFALYPLDKRRRVAAIALSGLLAGVIVLTQSAGALFIGIPAAALTLLLLAYGRRALRPIAAAAAAGAGLFALLMSSERFSRILTGEGTAFVRLRVWESALEMLRDHPLTGIGLDQFLYLYRGRYVRPDAWQEPNLSHPHQIALDFWLRLGLPGLLLLIVLLILFTRAALQLHQRARQHDALTAAMAAGALGMMAGLVAHGLVDNSVFVNDLALVFALALGSIAALDRHSHETGQRSMR